MRKYERYIDRKKLGFGYEPMVVRLKTKKWLLIKNAKKY